ncbi:hypothetical protein FRB98_008549 [Tulasnella sp. 332]|nr:hypothetical protein FRB98_008549 [Tulasnella sp. 332]
MGAISTINALPHPQTGVICVPPPPPVASASAVPGDAIAVGLEPPTSIVWELTNTGGAATLTTSGYNSGLLVSPGGGPFGAWDPTACEYYFLQAAPTASTVISAAKALSWSPTISSATSTWISAVGKDLVWAATGSSRFFACERPASTTTPEVTFDVFVDTGIAVDPPTLPAACQVVQILVR